MTAIYHSLQSGDFYQDWSDTSLITTDDDWSGVASIQGFRGDGLTSSTGTDPQTILADGSSTPLDVNANEVNPDTFTTGGIAEFDALTDPTVALQGSGTADAPHLVLYMDTTGVSGVNVSFDLRDIDGSGDDATQAIAVQYRIGGSGDFVNLPAAFVPDATQGGTSGLVTHVSATLPVSAENQSQVEIRIITANASGSDEWVGIDNIAVTTGAVEETPAKLLLSEIVVTPTGGEFIEIYNPGDSAVDLSDFYLTDATYGPDGTYYYNLPTGTNAGGGAFGDFFARFTDGASIAAGEYLTVALAGSEAFFLEYGIEADFELWEDGDGSDSVYDMREAFTGSISDQGGLTNSGEFVALIEWDGESDLVTDHDYAIWGDTAEAVDKTGVSIDGPDADTDASTYADDTAIADQDIISATTHASGNSYQRVDMTEGAQVTTGGNGATGGDETSEDLSNTWTEAAVTPGTGYEAPEEPSADAPELLLSEVVVTPTGGEFIEIYNASDEEVDLSNVYLTDATFAGDSTYYYNLVNGVNAGGGSFSDFFARFGEGATIAAGAYITVALSGSDAFLAEYGIDADYELWEDGDGSDSIGNMEEAFAGSINGQGGLTNGGEMVSLLYWDGESDLVTDLDYVLWGDTAEAVDKTGVSIDGPDADSDTSTYADDTAIADQEIIAAATHASGNSYQRVDFTEGTETQTGGNGVGGDDETSENLSETWVEAAVTPGEAAEDAFFSKLVINEFLADPDATLGDANGDGTVSTTQDEFVELVNVTASDLDISGWTLSDGVQVRHTFDAGTVLAAGQAIVVFGGGTPTGTFSGAMTATASTGSLGLNNGGDTITIHDADSAIVTEVIYGSEGGNNQSLSRDPDLTGEFVEHSTIADASGTLYSPGTETDGTAFGQVPEPELVKIHEIQGNPGTQSGGSDNNDGSPLLGQTVTIEAIVVGDFQDDDADGLRNLSGFYVQEEDADVDGDATTSEGIFVYDPALLADVNVGDKVLITGVVDEYFGETQLSSVSSIDVVSTGNATPTAAVIDLSAMGTSLDQDGGYQADLEAYEGMLVEFADTLTITEMYQMDRFNEITLSENGRVEQFTQSNTPDATAYDAFLQELGQTTIIYDDGQNIQNQPVTELPGFENFYTDSSISMGDTIDSLSGVLSYQWAGNSASNATWRVRSTVDGENTFDDTNEREATPEDVGGDLTIATFNVLNFFTTLDTFPGTEGVGADQSQDPRGADTNPQNAVEGVGETDEFDRQVEKLVTALAEMDADVLGLIEIENDFLLGGLSPVDTDAQDPRGLAITYLVDALNDRLGAEVYTYVDPGQEFVGGDAIAVGYIYKTETVSVAGAADIVDDAAFLDPNGTGEGKNRAALIQTFMDNLTGETFTTALNHFKSKGQSSLTDETSADYDQADGQGFWNDTRTKAAEYLSAYLAANFGDDRTVILGDLNAYASEDPITYLEGAGFTDLAELFLGDEAYSYVFDGQIGTLDYAMGDADFTALVSGVTEWHINSDEADVLDYNLEFGRDPTIFDGTTPYRASDHDPIIVGLDLPGDVTIYTDSGFTTQVQRYLTLGEALDDVLTGQAIDISPMGEATRLLPRLIDVDGITIQADADFCAVFQMGRGIANFALSGETHSTVMGNKQDNMILGSDGDNILSGKAGMDTLYGGAGYDLLIGGLGADWLDGGADFDIATYVKSAGRVGIDLTAGTGSFGFADGDTLLNIEAVTGSLFGDEITGDDGDNLLRGLHGRDWISAGDGDDLLVGGKFADTLIGGDGIDTASYVRSAKGVIVDLSSGIGLRGDARGDVLSGIENLTGSLLNDVLTGDAGANALRGLSGDDILIGGAGEDRLYGGLGNDVLEGGADADLFVFKEEEFGADIIADFQDGVDAILGLSYSDLTGSQMGSNAVFTLNIDPSQSITFLNTLVTDIDVTDFL